ncbi:MFS transporter [Opitutales bacterium]|nr:MFS transporter [Opitutales bacterium]
MKTRNYAWGVGGVADNLLTFGLAWTIIPVFNIGYGVDAFWLGIAIFLPRVIDVLTDPLMGILSDRSKLRWGRRKPFIFIGAVLMSLFFALLWMPPVSALEHVAVETTTENWFGLPPLPAGDELMLLLWIAGVYTLIALSYTVFSVPYIALGYEFARNYDIITKVMASRLYFTTIASFGVTWLYALSVSDQFGGDETLGMRSVGIWVGIAALLTGIIPALICTEEPQGTTVEKKAPIGEVLKATLGNRAFILVMSSMLLFVIAIYTAGVMGNHINIFYVAQGDKVVGAKLAAISANIMIGCNLIGMYLMMRVSRCLDKRTTALICFGLIFVGNASYWWTWNPSFPEMQYLSSAVIGFGNSGIWLMLDSMIGDVTKDDEARSGVQREGLFGAGKSFMFKIAVAVTSITGALVIGVSGFEEQVLPDEGVQLNLRLLYIGLQCGGVAVASAIIWFFPISRERAEENERIINERVARLISEAASPGNV